MISSKADEIPGNPEKLDSDQVLKSIVLNCHTCLMQTLQRSLLWLKQESNLHDITFAKSNFPYNM